MHKTVRCAEQREQFRNAQNSAMRRTARVPRTGDTARGQNGGRLNIGDALSCTFLSYEDHELLIWPKQGCGNPTGRKMRPPAGHRHKNNSIGTKKCRPAQNIADRQTVAGAGQFCLFTSSVIK
ncbi:hypothetical protein HYC85_028356 [Camellia sinensis]|uniref:Uncharacterized protein n=1 Tax=Camellia sinensis TaxID=4442 RepID=A0A7J7FV16_CAMSI|nr:hypothetical protein HYC85_028356 [Camellia sinensis]